MLAQGLAGQGSPPLSAKHVAAWIEANLYLNLADAPFDREDPTLSPAAGACATCPRRSGYNTSLFSDVEGDQCLDAPCYHAKIAAHIEREIAARPELVQIETSWRSPKEQKPGILKQGAYRELDTPENPDAEPPCASTRTAIVVYGKRVGTTATVCTDKECPVHDPHRAARQRKVDTARISPPALSPKTEEQQPEQEDRRKQYAEEQERRAEERRQQCARQQEQYEAERVRRAELEAARLATFDRILENAPATFSAAQLRVFLRALIHLAPYTFIDDVAAHFAGEDENNQQAAEEILLTTLGGLTDDKLTGFALRLALTGHTGIPRESEIDFLSQAAAAFVPPKRKAGKAAMPTPAKAERSKPAATKGKKKAAA